MTMSTLTAIHRIIPLAAATAIAAAAASCSHLPPAPAGSQYVELAQPWLPGGVVEFTPQLYGSLESRRQPFDLLLSVRYTRNCQANEIVMVIEEMSLDNGVSEPDTVVVPLFSPSGTPLGKGAYNVFEQSVALHDDYPLPDGYTFSVTPAMPVRGVISVGYRLMR